MDNVTYDLLRSDGSIVVSKSLIQSIGLRESILFGELLSRYNYFSERNMLKDGWFYNTQYDLQAGTGLGEKAQRTTISKLKRLGLIDCRIKGVPATRHFKIIASDELLHNLLKAGKEKLRSLENPADTSVGGNLKQRRKELVTDKRSGNNTKNITKHNTKYSIILANDVLLSYYGKRYKEKHGIDHPPVNNMEWIRDRLYEWVDEAPSDIEDMKQRIDDYIGKTNAGGGMIHVFVSGEPGREGPIMGL